MAESYFVDRLPRWLAFTIQALCMYLFFWFWVAFFILPPFLYYGSTTTKIILCLKKKIDNFVFNRDCINLLIHHLQRINNLSKN